MLNATLIVPVGNLTPALSRRVRETAFESAQQHDVIISMQSTEHYAWSALYDLADLVREVATPHQIRLAGALPRTRSLLRELGIERAAFVSDDDVRPREYILIA